jgi:hypothetical protein
MAFYKRKYITHLMHVYFSFKNTRVELVKKKILASNDTFSTNSMSQMPGKMSEMPRLPVWVNENLASYLLPDPRMVSTSSSCHWLTLFYHISV